MPQDFKDRPADFPPRGLDVAGEYSQQPPGTTPAAVNVRAVEPAGQRLRGGSRPGTEKLSFRYRGVTTTLGTVSGQPAGPGSPVQMLVPFSTVGLDAHLSCDDPFNVYNGPNSEPDTSDGGRSAGRWRRVGGSGVQPLCDEGPAPQAVSFLQGKLRGLDWTSTFHSYSGSPFLAFDSPVAAGSLIVVCFQVSWSIINSQNHTYAVSDTLGTSFTLLKSYGPDIGGAIERPRFSVWGGFAPSAGADTVTVNVTWADLTDPGGSPVGGTMAVVNYSGPTGANGAVDLTSDAGSSNIALSMDTGTAVNQGHLALGCFSHEPIVSPFTRTVGPAGFSLLLFGNGATGSFGQDREMTVTALTYPTADPLHATLALNAINGFGDEAWAAVGVRFKADGT